MASPSVFEIFRFGVWDLFRISKNVLRVSAPDVAMSDSTGKSSDFTMFSSFFEFLLRTVDCLDSSEHAPNGWHGGGEFCGEFSASAFAGAASVGVGVLSVAAVALVVSGALSDDAGASFVAVVASFVPVAIVSLVPVTGAAFMSAALVGGLGCCFVGSVLKFGRVAMAAASWPASVWV